MNKISLIISIATVIFSVLNIIMHWDNDPAVYGWIVAAMGWLQLAIPQRKI
jgi:hypothetical protein